VVGPTFDYGNFAILAFDMTHRTHFNLFGYYYPPEFANWWADDWVTRIYAPTHLDRLERFTLRHIQVYGEQVRYVVNYLDESMLNPAVKRDRHKVASFFRSWKKLYLKELGKLDLVKEIVTNATSPVISSASDADSASSTSTSSSSDSAVVAEHDRKLLEKHRLHEASQSVGSYVTSNATLMGRIKTLQREV